MGNTPQWQPPPAPRSGVVGPVLVVAVFLAIGAAGAGAWMVMGARYRTPTTTPLTTLPDEPPRSSGAMPAPLAPLTLPAPAATPPPPPPPSRVAPGTSAGDCDVTGGEGEIDANAVARLMRRQLGGIRSCYERALATTPRLAGQLDVRFTVGPTGRVESINAQGMNAAPEVGSCVSSALRRIAYPQPSGGSVDFSCRFTFAP